MKKFFSVLAIALFAFALNASAQYEKGQIDANVGIGLGATFSTGTVNLPPVSLSLDFGINDKISLGGFVGYSASKEDFSGFGVNYAWKYTYVIVGAGGAYHFDLVDNMDTYAGLLLGYNVASVKYDGANKPAGLVEPSAGGLAYAGFLGARYHFGEKFGVYGELGYGIALLNVGLTMKL